MRLHGLLSFPLTPFTGEGKVDLPAFAAHVEVQISHEPSAIFVTCGTGEFPALSFQEFREVVSTAVTVAKGRLPTAPRFRQNAWRAIY